MEIWSDLVATALLGTERQSRPLSATPGQLGALLDQLQAADPAAALLGAAGAVAHCQRAGWTAPLGQLSPVQPCPSETQPPCSHAAQHRLSALFESQPEGLLREWLCALAAAGRRVPAICLPALLDWGRREQGRLHLLSPILGKR